MNTIKVKVIKSSANIGSDYYDDYARLYPVSTDWEEVTLEEANEIQDAVRYANMNNKSSDYYIFLEYNEDVVDEVFKLASQFKTDLLYKKALEEKRAADAKAKRDAQAQERKRKQLEKLKKELGEE